MPRLGVVATMRVRGRRSVCEVLVWRDGLEGGDGLVVIVRDRFGRKWEGLGCNGRVLEASGWVRNVANSLRGSVG